MNKIVLRSVNRFCFVLILIRIDVNSQNIYFQLFQKIL